MTNLDAELDKEPKVQLSPEFDDTFLLELIEYPI